MNILCSKGTLKNYQSLFLFFKGFFLVLENILEKSQDRLFRLKSTGSRILVVFWLLGLLVIVCG